MQPMQRMINHIRAREVTMKRISFVVVAHLCLLLLTACGDGSDGTGTEPAPPPPPEPTVTTATGQFKVYETNVQGLDYMSGDTSGVTDAEGTFTYELHDDVAQAVICAIGNVVLGEADGQATLTPVDLVAGGDTGSQEVQNIARFLVMLDDDANPAADGILISPDLQTLADDWPEVDFTLEEMAFDSSPEVVQIMSDAASVNTATPVLWDSETTQGYLEGEPPPSGGSYIVPEMVTIPGGSFQMGCEEDDNYEVDPHEYICFRSNISPERRINSPKHFVTVPSFRMGKYEVTVSQWAACIDDGVEECLEAFPTWIARSGLPRASYQGPNRPVIDVSRDNAQAFIDWLNGKTGGGYRLPTEAEWEYAARAGSTTRFHFGNDPSEICRYANFDSDVSPNGDFNSPVICSDGSEDDDFGIHTADVGSYLPNAFGLYDTIGNVREWVQDCEHRNYLGAPSDGSAWISDCWLYDDGTPGATSRGGGWSTDLDFLGDALRDGTYNAGPRSGPTYGLRLAQDL